MSTNAIRWLVLSGVWLLYAAFGLIATSLAPLVSIVVADLQLNHAAMGSILGAWQLVYIGAAIPCGMLLDRLPSRWALAIGAALIAASALGRALADDYLTLLGAVMLFGLGGPIISAGAPTVIAQWFQGPQRGLAMGIYMTGPAIGGVISLTATHAVLLPAFDGDWRSVMLLWSGLSLFAGLFWILIGGVPAIHRTNASHQAGRHAQPPGLIGRLIRLPSVQLVMLMSVGAFAFNHGLNNWLPELLRQGGMTLIQAGYWAAIPTLIGIAGSLLIPRLATPGRRFPILFGLCLSAALASLLLQFSSGTALLSGLLLQGIARSSLMTVLILTLVELPEIGERHAGTASGLFFSAAEIGGVLGPLGLGVMYELTGGFAAALYTLTAVATALALAVIRLRRLATQAAKHPAQSPG